MEILLSITLLVFGILQIILFFKIWGMTNNIARINEKLEPFNPIIYAREYGSEMLNKYLKNHPNVVEIVRVENVWLEKVDGGKYKVVVEFRIVHKRDGEETKEKLVRCSVMILCTDFNRMSQLDSWIMIGEPNVILFFGA